MDRLLPISQRSSSADVEADKVDDFQFLHLRSGVPELNILIRRVASVDPLCSLRPLVGSADFYEDLSSWERVFCGGFWREKVMTGRGRTLVILE